MARVMIVAGGDWQVELVKKAKAMGHYVICSNLYSDSPAFKYSDVGVVADVLDKNKNLEIATQYRPDAVISDQSDIAVPTVAYLNEKLGLNGIGIERADLFTDKSLQRQFCKSRGISIPDFKLCHSINDAKEMLFKHNKIIIKPIDSQSSRGVFTIDSLDMLKEKYEETANWSNRRKYVLAEEYISGDEFTIDGIVINRKHYPLCISIKKMYECNKNISCQQDYSHFHEIYDYGLLREINKKLVESTGLSMGLTHAEYKYNNGKFYLIEIGARGGGSNLSAKIVPFMSGVDNYEYLLKEALGEPVSDLQVRDVDFSSDKYVVMKFFDFGEGTVDYVENKDYLVNHPMLLDYQLEIKNGDVLHNPKYGRLRPGHFIIGGIGKENVLFEAQKIIEKVRVVFK